MEHSLGVKNFFFFPPLSPHVKSCIFLNTLSPVLSTPLSYVCCVCMDRLMANFAGTCTSDNKGLLLNPGYEIILRLGHWMKNFIKYVCKNSEIYICELTFFFE